MDAKHQTLRNYYLDKGLVAGRVAIALLWINIRTLRQGARLSPSFP